MGDLPPHTAHLASQPQYLPKTLDNQFTAPSGSQPRLEQHLPGGLHTPTIKQSPSQWQEPDLQFFNRINRRNVVIPKGVVYDGTGCFSTFREKFRSYLFREDFPDDGTDLYALSLALRGKASEFYERTNARCRFRSVSAALESLQERFDASRHWKSALLHFHSAAQAAEENAQEYEDRLWSLAHQAYPQYTEQQVEREVLLRFILGLRDRAAVQYLSLQNFNSMREAIDGLRIYEYSLSVSGLRPQGNKVRQVDVGEVDTSAFGLVSESPGQTFPENDAPYDIRQVKNKSPSNNSNHFKSSHGGSAIDRLETTIGDLVKVVKDMSITMKDMQKEIRDLKEEVRLSRRGRDSSRPAFREKSPNRVSFRDSRRSPSPERGCYNCGSPDHFIADCPKPRRSKVRAVGSENSLPDLGLDFDHQDFRLDPERYDQP